MANGATIQGKGVLQVEAGYDAYPQSVPGDQQTVDTLVTYAPLDRLRLDMLWSAFNHQQEDEGVTNGVGTMQIGGKVVLKKEDYHRAGPGFALQYEAALPDGVGACAAGLRAAGDADGESPLWQGWRPGCDRQRLGGAVGLPDEDGISYGGQQSFAVSYHVNKQTRLYAEVFGQNVSQSNTPPGTYVFGDFIASWARRSGSMAECGSG